jgi:peptidoglycan/xylan/chitin deacetylase (PgdA/CDA1 family)
VGNEKESMRSPRDFKNALKIGLLHLLKLCGGFIVARALTRRFLRVICYHGVSLSDEHLFRSNLFMRPETFRRRLEHLRRAGYRVLPLGTALDRLSAGALPASSVAITIDDGWHGSLQGAFSPLRERGLPATLYVTTYYAFGRTPVFDVSIGYLFWKTEADSVELDGLSPGLSGRVDLSSAKAREDAAELVVDHGNRSLSCEERIELTRRLATRLGLEYDEIERKRLFQLISPEDLASLVADGVDVQLHTHRHSLDVTDRTRVQKEIQDNRDKLEPLVGKTLEHFCYPSGVFHPRVWPWLEEMGIRSATTTAVGLCRRETPRFALPRIVDGENVPDIEFEAEMAGALEIFRRLRAWC